MNILAGSNILEPAGLSQRVIRVSDAANVLVFVLNALQSYNNSNIVDVLRRKYVLGPTQAHFSPSVARAKMSLSRAQNIFTPKNINYIVILSFNRAFAPP